MTVVCFQNCSSSLQSLRLSNTQNKLSGNAADVTPSPFQTEFLVVYDFLYSLMNLKTYEAPTILAESLCRDNWNAPNFEIVNHYDYRSGDGTTRIYYKSADSEKIQTQFESSTQRLLTPFEVNYQSYDQKLKYAVNFKSANGTYGRKYNGQITHVDSSMPNLLKVGAIECVTGGGLDSSVWPIRKVNISPTISKFLVHPTENDIYFDDRNPNHVN